GEARRSYLRMAGLPLDKRYKGVSWGFRPETKKQLLPGWSTEESDARLEEIFQPYFRAARAWTPLDRMTYVDTKVWLPDDILVKADKMTMANALELRVPFLDHKLVEFAAMLPGALKLNGSGGKHLLRQAMKQVLPQPILRRPKRGFPTPTARWLRGPLRDMV